MAPLWDRYFEHRIRSLYAAWTPEVDQFRSLEELRSEMLMKVKQLVEQKKHREWQEKLAQMQDVVTEYAESQAMLYKFEGNSALEKAVADNITAKWEEWEARELVRHKARWGNNLITRLQEFDRDWIAAVERAEPDEEPVGSEDSAGPHTGKRRRVGFDLKRESWQ